MQYSHRSWSICSEVSNAECVCHLDRVHVGLDNHLTSLAESSISDLTVIIVQEWLLPPLVE